MLGNAANIPANHNAGGPQLMIHRGHPRSIIPVVHAPDAQVAMTGCADIRRAHGQCRASVDSLPSAAHRKFDFYFDRK